MATLTFMRHTIFDRGASQQLVPCSAEECEPLYEVALS